jgi:hypothetical protein
LCPLARIKFATQPFPDRRNLDSIHAAVPHSLLEAVRLVDRRPDAESDDEIAAKKFGASKTVVAQIARYSSLSADARTVPASEVEGLLTLVTRRLDADLVLKIAGQFAAARMIKKVRTPMGLDGLLPAGTRRRFALRAARKVLKELLGARLAIEAGDFVVYAGAAPIEGELRRVKCDYDGAVVGEVLGVLCGFVGALRHEECRADGAEVCSWRVIKSGRN